ncbi:MAG: AbrB/MazE/SpoVT family DNA-binding domain-containing protein [Phycisphaerae bacterium]
MAISETTKVGKRGSVVIPSKLRKRFGINEGTQIVAEEREDGILLRPAAVVPIEIYTNERIAEFLLNNSVDAKDYASSVEEVRKLGLDPEKIPHVKPPGV